MVSADLAQSEQIAFDQAAEALRLPNAREWAHEAVSGVRELSPECSASASRTAPPAEAPPAAVWTHRRRGRKPSRRDQSRRRRGLGATPGTGGECDKHSITGQFFDKKGGVAPSPDPDPDTHRPPSTVTTERTRTVLTGTSISTNKGGVALVAYEIVAPTRSEPQKPMSKSSRRSAKWIV